MSALKTHTPEELTARNIELGLQIDAIRAERKEITAELDRRAAVERDARHVASLPEHLQDRLMGGLDNETMMRFVEIRAEQERLDVPVQMVAPDGVASGEAVGTPGGFRRWLRGGS